MKDGQYPRINLASLEMVPTRAQGQEAVCASVGNSPNLVLCLDIEGARVVDWPKHGEEKSSGKE